MMSKNSKSLCVGVAGIILAVANMFYKVYVVTRLWDYVFVKSGNAQPIHMWTAFAISYFIAFCAQSFDQKLENKDDKDIYAFLKKGLLGSFGISFCWLLGYALFG